MISTAELLANASRANISEILTANSCVLKVKSVGNVNSQVNNVMLVAKEVLHVPDLSVNLLSVAKMCENGSSNFRQKRLSNRFTRQRADFALRS